MKNISFKSNEMALVLGISGAISFISLFAILISNRRTTAAYDEGWFNGYTEAKKDYDREIKMLRRKYDELIEKRNQSIYEGKQRLADLIARRNRTVEDDISKSASCK